MKQTKKVTIIVISLLLTIPLTMFSVYADNPDNNPNIRIINIAQYPLFGGGCDHTVNIVFNYTWKANNTIYKFRCTALTLEEVAGGGEKPLNIENYDLLYVGVNYWSYIKDGLNKKLQNNIKKFLSEGGGYIGSCAGVTFASQGFEKPKGVYQRATNRGVLGIADIYLNQDWFGELQYCMRSALSLPPIKLKVEKSDNPIFAEYKISHINLTYGGGAGLYEADKSDSKLGKITPLLKFDEELMEIKPLHWYIKGLLPGWIPIKKVKTDLLGYHAAIATTYNNSGKIVLFSCHAEIPLAINGTIKERFGKRPTYSSFGKLPRIVYEWNGTYINMSHNWWLHRRAAAWIAGVPESDLPPCNELMVFMDKPQFRIGHQFYVNNTQLDLDKYIYRAAKKMVKEAGMTIIEGNITVEAYAENSDIVEFYLDGALEYTDSTRPFTWDLDNKLEGVHRLELRAYDEYGNFVCDGSEFFFVND